MTTFIASNTTTPVFTAISQADDPVLRGMYQVPMSTLLSPQIVLGIRTIRETADKVATWKKNDTFILFLQQIRYWNDRLIIQETDRIKRTEPRVEQLYHDFLNNLIRKVTCNPRVSYKDLKGSYFMKLKDYIHRVYCDVAERIVNVNGDLLHLNDYARSAVEAQLMRVLAIDKVEKMIEQFGQSAQDVLEPSVRAAPVAVVTPSSSPVDANGSSSGTPNAIGEPVAATNGDGAGEKTHDTILEMTEEMTSTKQDYSLKEPEKSQRSETPRERTERSETPRERTERSERRDERSEVSRRGRDEQSERRDERSEIPRERTESSEVPRRVREETSEKSVRPERSEVSRRVREETSERSEFVFRRPTTGPSSGTSHSTSNNLLASLARMPSSDQAAHASRPSRIDNMALRELSEAIIDDFEHSSYAPRITDTRRRRHDDNPKAPPQDSHHRRNRREDEDDDLSHFSDSRSLMSGRYFDADPSERSTNDRARHKKVSEKTDSSTIKVRM